MTQSEWILRTRFGIIHACPVQSGHQITSIRLHSALQQMMRTRQGGGGNEEGRLKQVRVKTEAEIDGLVCYWREEEALRGDVYKGRE